MVEITGGQTLREVEARRSELITGYTKLAFSAQPGESLPTHELYRNKL